jgi:hypothetical protein
MTKHYVFPLNGTTILLSVKSPLNPRTHAANFMASLPNPIGGNSQGTKLQTLQAEAAEETRSKVVINGADTSFFESANMYFYTSVAFTYTPAHALGAAQLLAISTATDEWDNAFDMSCKGDCAVPDRAACRYCSYLDDHKQALTFLENTGEVASLDLMLVDPTNETTTAQSVHDRVQGIAELSAVTDEFTTSKSLAAIRKLAAWTKFRVHFNTLKAEVAQALVHATGRLAPPHAPTALAALGNFSAAMGQVQIKSGNIAGSILLNYPTLPVNVIALVGDATEAPVLQQQLATYRATNILAPAPGARFGRHAYLKDVAELIKQLHIAESLRV